MKKFALVFLALAILALTSCSFLAMLFARMEGDWSGTAYDEYIDVTYTMTVSLEQDGDDISGSGTFYFSEEGGIPVSVTGTFNGADDISVTLLDVDGADVLCTGELSDGGDTYSGTWDLGGTYPNSGTFTLERVD